VKVGIVGYSGSGKSTVFHWLTGVAPDPAKASQRGQTGVAKVPDPRLDLLSAKFNPRKTTAAALEFLDTPGLLLDERKDNARRLSIFRDANGLLVVLNGFSESNLAEQLHRFRQEIIFADLEIVTNRIEKITAGLKKPRPAKEKELEQAELTLLQRIVQGFETEKMPTELGLKEDEEKLIRSFQLLTLKPTLAFANIGDDRIGKSLPADLLKLDADAVQAPVKLEMELLDLGEDDRAAFMADLNLTGFQRDAVVRAVFSAMGRIVFFTVGEDECRAWPIPKGADAVEGAGEIHTDLAQKFVRAEVVGYDDFIRVGSMKEAKAAGVYRLEGKTYIVKDGDIMHIL
jgi:ribosome-binding ATPase